MNLSKISQVFRIIFFTVGRLGVPIFLFLTGVFNLKKQIDTDEDVLKFYKKKLVPLFITIEIWNLLYNIFNWLIKGEFRIERLLKNIFFLEQVQMSNMWYMPMILGMYIAIPFIAKLVKTFSLKTIKMPMIIIFISCILFPSINIILYIFEINGYMMILDLNFLGRSLWYIYIIGILYE